jgi:hypothetical protein
MDIFLAEITRILPLTSGALAVVFDRAGNSAGPLLLQPIGRPRQSKGIMISSRGKADLA